MLGSRHQMVNYFCSSQSYSLLTMPSWVDFYFSPQPTYKCRLCRLGIFNKRYMPSRHYCLIPVFSIWRRELSYATFVVLYHKSFIIVLHDQIRQKFVVHIVIYKPSNQSMLPFMAFNIAITIRTFQCSPICFYQYNHSFFPFAYLSFVYKPSLFFIGLAYKIA